MDDAKKFLEFLRESGQLKEEAELPDILDDWWRESLDARRLKARKYEFGSDRHMLLEAAWMMGEEVDWEGTTTTMEWCRRLAKMAENVG